MTLNFNLEACFNTVLKIRSIILTVIIFRHLSLNWHAWLVKKNLTPEPLTQSKPRTHISYCCQMWSRLNNLDQIPEIKRQLTLYGELKYTQYTWCTQLFFFSLHILCRRFLWYGSFDFFKIFREDASPSEVYRGDSF